MNGTVPCGPERLAELFQYDPETGALLWRVHRGSKIKPGKPAGGKNGQGYIDVMLDGKHIKAHRIAWAMVYGYWPAWPIDHIDGRRDNNAIANLREITTAGNSQNVTEPRSNNQTGFLGVWKRGDRYAAEIRAGGKTTRLGTFATAEEASAAYRAAKLEIHTAGQM